MRNKRIKYRERQALLNSILTILNKSNDWHAIIREILCRIKTYSKMESVALRLLDGMDYPFYEAIGFRSDFISQEQGLAIYDGQGCLTYDEQHRPLLDCMCGRVIRQETEAIAGYCTPGGSFFLNQVTPAGKTWPEDGTTLFNRFYCIRAGYESMALIPVSVSGEVIGLLQLHDQHPDKISLTEMEFFEELGATIGIAYKRLQAETKIRNEELQFRMLFQNGPFPRWIYDTSTLEFLDVNKAAVENYGYSREEFLRMTIKDIRPDCEIDWLMANLREENDEIQHSEGWHHRKKDGTLINVEISSHATIYNCRPARVVLALDVTERLRYINELKSTREYLQKLLDHSGAPIVTWNPDLTIRHINRAFEHMTGYSHAELNGQPLDILFPPDEAPQILDMIYDTASGRQWESVEIPIIRKDSHIRHLLWNSANIFDSGKKNILATIAQGIDITDRIESEQHIRKINQALELAKTRAEEADKLKTSLLNNMSHEIRTPMNAILGFSSLIENNACEEDIRDMAHRIYHGGSRLMKTLDDILTLSQLQSGNIREAMTLLKPDEEILALIPGFRQRALEKNLRFEYYRPHQPMVRVAKSEFLMALSHLVDNAIKFTASGCIRIEVAEVIRDQRTWAAVSVSDTGIGINPQYHSVIFDSFRQLSEGYGRNFEGSGLGLSIAARAMEIMDGKILVESKPEQGSVFTILLPAVSVGDGHPKVIGQAGRTSAVPFSDPPPVFSRLKILIVEDNEDNIMVMSFYLKGLHDLHTARNAAEAIKMASQQLFDLILMDINLGPGMDGMQTTAIIRTLDGYRHIPIIAVTGYTSQTEKTDIFNAGCSHFLAKPFTRADILKMIGNTVQQQ